jgi:hypothetical protein
MGIQIVGPYLEDRTPIHAALLMDDLFGGFVRPPQFEENEWQARCGRDEKRHALAGRESPRSAARGSARVER